MNVPDHLWDGGCAKTDMMSTPYQTNHRAGRTGKSWLMRSVKAGLLFPTIKDFGELVFKNRLPHRGIVLMRLDDERIETKIDVISRFLKTFTEPIMPGHFIVLTERGVRISSIN